MAVIEAEAASLRGRLAECSTGGAAAVNEPDGAAAPAHACADSMEPEEAVQVGPRLSCAVVSWSCVCV